MGRSTSLLAFWPSGFVPRGTRPEPCAHNPTHNGVSQHCVNTVDNSATSGVYWTSSTRIRGVDMIVIVGLIVLVVAVIVGFTGVLTNAGAAHPLTDSFAVFGYHVTGSTGTLVPLRDRGRGGGDAGSEHVCWPVPGAPRAAGEADANSRDPTRNGVSEPATATNCSNTNTSVRPPTTRRTSERATHPPRQGSPARTLVTRSSTDRPSACR